MKRIGILGGSFDPVHLGHISLAKDAISQCGLDSVIFMPAYRQPFKLDTNLSSDVDRLAMLEDALGDNPKLQISPWEIENKGISYTYLTLRSLREGHPDDKYYFITGADTFLKINIWKNADELLADNRFIIGNRPGYREQELLKQISIIREKYSTEILLINNLRLDISATNIRKKVALGESITSLVPAAVERYITEHGLYLRRD